MTQDFEVTFETKPTEGDPFLGIIVRDEQTRTVFAERPRVQWAVAVRPVKGMHVQGKTGAMHGYAEKKTTKNSKYMRALKDYSAVFGNRYRDDDPRVEPRPDLTDAVRRPEHGELIGLVGWFALRSYSFGGQVSEGNPFPVPVRLPTADELEEARALPPYQPPAEATGSASVDVTEAVERNYTPEMIEAALEIYDGHTAIEIAQIANAAADSLPADVREDLVNGRLLRYLQSEKLLAAVTGGRYARAVLA